MTSDRWQQACQLFAAALERPASERAVFLAQACGDDAELRREVETLLASDPHADSAFQQLPGAVVAAASGTDSSLDEHSPESLVGTRIGRYEIKRVIGSGGMSTVYEAEQERPHRTVALKLMKPGVVSKSALRRFEFESETLARLRHPNIAQIYEAGTYSPSPLKGEGRGEGGVSRSQSQSEGTSGGQQTPAPHPTLSPAGRGLSSPSPSQGEGWGEGVVTPSPSEGEGWSEGLALPWFAMEYLPGALPITEYARAAGLSIRERLALFVKVCHAVAHGHEKGVIHRDLKPANILVSDDGNRGLGIRDRTDGGDWGSTDPRSRIPVPCSAEPKVIDFGIARATDADVTATTRETQAGALIGTLQYMSPEQCGYDPPPAAPTQSEPRRVSERSDIDTRSDVYSLGVVLYELLADRLPYDVSTTTIYRAIKIVAEHEPQPLSQLNTLSKARRAELRGDVEAIVKKALAKDRAHRYRSAADLAADIERHLRGDPTEARPPTAWHRTTRWIGRHPKIVTAVFCSTFAVMTLSGSYLARYWPHIVNISGTEAHLLTLTGQVLRTWRTNNPNASGFRWAKLVDSTSRVGPKKLVLLGYPNANSEYPGRLCAFDANAPEGFPVWTTHIRDDQLPQQLRNSRHSGAEFGVHKAMIADIFDKPPGDELVVAFSCSSSARLLRVYDLAGRVLYQVWIDGSIWELYWMKAAGLLVLATEDKAYRWDDGHLRNLTEPDPRIVLALRPALGHIATDWLPRQCGHDPLSPVWCLQLDPIQASKHVTDCSVTQPDAPIDPERFVLYQVFLSFPDKLALSWTIDESGRAKPGEHPNDDYKKYQQLAELGKLPPGMPDPDSLTLVEYHWPKAPKDADAGAAGPEPPNPDAGSSESPDPNAPKP